VRLEAPVAPPIQSQAPPDDWAMITVKAKLFALLRRFRPEVGLGEPFPVTLPHGATVGDLIREIGVPEDEVKLVFVNGLFRDLDYVLSDGDELGIFPPVGGG
jgi:molybdopterin converting factor small subunit